MKNLIKKTSLTIIAATLAITGFAPIHADIAELKEKLPKFVGDGMEALGIESGLSIAVVAGDETVYRGSFGYADIENGLKVKHDTSFYIASSTKSFTGLAALILADEGLLDLDQSLAAFFPDITFDPALKANQINIRHLLSHTHGLKNTPIVTAVAYTGNHTPTKSLELLKHTTVNEKAPFGTYDYSNLGYNIFSMILERQLGAAWQDILAKKIFEPAGMMRTSSYMSDAKQEGWQVARPYGYGIATPRTALYLTKKDNTMHAAGGMIASAGDLARFLQAQMSDGKINGKQVFPAHLISESHKSLTAFEEKRRVYVRTGYGMGWMIGTFEGETSLSHFGGFAGSHSHVSMLPDHKLGLVILTNEGQASQELATLIAGYVFDTMRDKEGIDEQRRAELITLVKRANDFKARMKKRREERASRSWSLSREFSAYAGNYSNGLYGTIAIEQIGPKKMRVRFGNMHAVATPFSDLDSIRLELVPGSGEVVTFAVNEKNILSLTYDGIVYKRD